METKKDISCTIDEFENVLHIEFGNGKKLSLDPTTIDSSIVRMATLHGFKQKLIDAGAISRNTITGKSATVDDKYNAVMEVFERLTSDEPTWNKVRESSGAIQGGLLLNALIRLRPEKDIESLKEFVNSKDRKEQAALRANPKIAAIIDEIRAEKLANGIDSDEMLDELDDI